MGLYLTVYEVTTPWATAGLRGVHATLAVVVLVRTALAMFGPARGTAGFQIREINIVEDAASSYIRPTYLPRVNCVIFFSYDIHM